jgi:hypothetical protein
LAPLVWNTCNKLHFLSDSTEMKGRQKPIYITTSFTRVVWKLRGLTLLLRVGTLWRCGDGLFFELLPLASDALLTTLHPLLANVLQTVCRKLQEDSGTGGFDLSRLILRLQSASTIWKPQFISLHRLHRLDGWTVGFQNSIAQRWRSTKEISSFSAIL